MRRIALLVVAALGVLGVGFWFGQASAQTGAAPGSAQDPLVSVSYVTQAISAALQGQVPSLVSQGIQSALPGVVTPLVQSTVQTDVQAAVKNLPTGGSTSVAVVSVPPGQELLADQGTEFVLRGGSAVVQLAPSSAGGFADLTSGENLAQGATVPQNQLLLAARTDGRGILPVGKARILVLVIGQYTVQAAPAQ